MEFVVEVITVLFKIYIFFLCVYVRARMSVSQCSYNYQVSNQISYLRHILNYKVYLIKSSLFM